MPLIFQTREPRVWSLIRNQVKSISVPINVSMVGNVGITPISKKLHAVYSSSATSVILKDV
jgi:hypothetical protein